jgi:type IV pilus assembly protein PilA
MNQGHYHPYPPPKSSGSSAVIIIVVVIVLIVPLLGVVASLAIYGVRRYLAAAKTTEAKNTVGAIARGAAAAYESETFDINGKPVHALCDSTGPNAPGHGPVPSAPPRAMKYMPSSAPGTDFETGTPQGGWRCLKFTVSQPMYYQYHYNKGGGYLYPTAPLGPNAFEAAAQGDIDGDGNPSLFTRSGAVNASGNLVLSTQIGIVEEFE